jgi:hypothetical protein
MAPMLCHAGSPRTQTRGETIRTFFAHFRVESLSRCRIGNLARRTWWQTITRCSVWTEFVRFLAQTFVRDRDRHDRPDCLASRTQSSIAGPLTAALTAAPVTDRRQRDETHACVRARPHRVPRFAAVRLLPPLSETPVRLRCRSRNRMPPPLPSPHNRIACLRSRGFAPSPDDADCVAQHLRCTK